MSPAARGLLRALLARAQVKRDRILLTHVHSTDWQSLTLVGERHEIHFSIPGPDAAAIAGMMSDGIEDAEFAISGQIVADIAVGGVLAASDGSLDVIIEALTVVE